MLRNLWMCFLVPTNPLLLGLTKELLLRKRVCEKHFDKTQFDGEDKRLQYSYPCLFTDDEITHGEPLAAVGTVRHALTDHNYFKAQDDDEDTTEQTLVIGSPGEDFHEHPSCSYPQVEASVGSVSQKKELVVADESSSSLPTVIEEGVLEVSAHTEIKPTPPHSLQEKELTRKRRGTIIKKLSSKRRKFVNNVINIASSSLGQTGEQRLSQAKSYGSNEQLFKNFDQLNKQAQTFLLMQLKQCRNNKMARRFTMKEKLMALTLMKQSPKA